jgi:hypothetical protein
MCERVRQDFDRDIAIKLGVAGPVDLSHPARAEQRADFVRAEVRAWSEGQFVGII